jgi:hypothetical protein
LPPVHADLALAKKGNRRATTQAAVSNAMEVLGHAQDFPITTKIASRVVDLEWAHQSTDDLSTGLNILHGAAEDVDRAIDIFIGFPTEMMVDGRPAAGFRKN